MNIARKFELIGKRESKGPHASQNPCNARYRGLFLVPRDTTAQSLSGVPDSLAHAHRIVAQVEREVEQQAARERVMRLRAWSMPSLGMPAVAGPVAALSYAPRSTSMRARAARFFAL